ncbi:MAG TPA: alpha/beta hydrolase [Xanthobacteraceae bacterium]|jgi:pimeloyl-ACP methyl ester carboxylesterase
MTVIVWILGLGLAAIVAVVGGLAVFAAWTARRVEKALPPRGRFIEVDGARIHYVDEGSGPPLVLIHGLGGQMHNFTHSLLDRLKHNHRVIILDRPGCGYSTRPRKGSAALGAQAKTVAGLVDKLGLERPLIVGHSLGGAIALMLALDHPEKIGGLALLAPATHAGKTVPPMFRGIYVRSSLMRRLVAWTLAIPMSITNRELVLGTVFGPGGAPPDFPIKGGGLLTLRPRSYIAASTDLIAAIEDLQHMPARYGELTVPVGVLFGASDLLLDHAVHGGGFVEKCPGAHIELIEDGGHMIIITAADHCADFITRMARRAATYPAEPELVA